MTQAQVVDLKTLTVGEVVSGMVYITEHGKHDGATKAPLYGELLHQGKTARFKVWASSSQHIVDIFNSYNCAGRIAQIVGEVSEYRGAKEITITSIQFVNEAAEAQLKHLFIKTADVTKLSTELWGLMSTELRETHKNFAMAYFQVNDNKAWGQFIVTWAGKKLHDAQVGGLLNHTLKMMRIAKTLVGNDTRLAPMYSLLQLSILFHDIGKLRELSAEDGSYTKVGYITHRSLGLEMLAEQKALCLEHLTEEEYYILLSVIQGHHGDFGDKPTSVYALFVHLVDMVDSKFTMVLDMMENGETDVKNENNVVKMPFSGERLVF